MKTNLTWRIAALIMVLLNVAFNSVYDKFLALPSIKIVTDHYQSLFVPASYAFLIWGFIYVAMIAYSIYQLLPSQRFVPLHDRISRPLVIANFLSIAWIIAFTSGFVIASVIIIGGMLATALVMYARIGEAVNKWGYRPVLAVPFSLFTAWLSVAIISNFSLALTSFGWSGGSFGEENWVMIMMAVVCTLGVVINYKFHDPIFPLVIIWALISFWVKYGEINSGIAGSALVSSSLLLLWTGLYSLSTGRKVQFSHQH